MTKPSAVLLAALLVVLSPFAPCAAAAAPQAAEPEAAAGERELVRIRAALERIADALERQQEGQKADLALRRLDMASEQALRLEAEISRLSTNRDSLTDERFRVQSQILAIVRGADGPESSYTAEEISNLREQGDLELKLLDARIAELERRLELLQNQLADRREAVRGWEAFIDRQLAVD